MRFHKFVYDSNIASDKDRFKTTRNSDKCFCDGIVFTNYKSNGWPIRFLADSSHSMNIINDLVLIFFSLKSDHCIRLFVQQVEGCLNVLCLSVDFCLRSTTTKVFASNWSLFSSSGLSQTTAHVIKKFLNFILFDQFKSTLSHSLQPSSSSLYRQSFARHFPLAYSWPFW